MNFAEVERAWDEIEAAGLRDGLRALETKLPVRIFATLREQRRGLYVAAPLKRVPEADYFDSHGLTLTELSQADLRGYLLLAQDELKDEFKLLITDLLNPDRYVLPADPGSVLKRFIELVSVWKLFFKKKRGPSAQEIQGFFGELVLIRTALQHGALGSQILSGWKAPDDEPVDFRFNASGIAIEVKTVLRTDIPRVTISSVEQLADLRGTDLFLLVIMARKEEGESIGDVARSILDLLPSKIEREFFRDSLVQCGFPDAVLSKIEKTRFSVADHLCFSVSAGFPRIHRSACHAAIREVRYILDLTALPPDSSRPAKMLFDRLGGMK